LCVNWTFLFSVSGCIGTRNVREIGHDLSELSRQTENDETLPLLYPAYGPRLEKFHLFYLACGSKLKELRSLYPDYGPISEKLRLLYSVCGCKLEKLRLLYPACVSKLRKTASVY
jgi:hypothetical protein